MEAFQYIYILGIIFTAIHGAMSIWPEPIDIRVKTCLWVFCVLASALWPIYWFLFLNQEDEDE